MLNSLFQFSALNQNGQPIHAEHYRGQYVLLYFYPKDNTPTCSQQAIDFRDNYPHFTALNTVIIGVSRDSAKTHINFKNKYALPFDLISDNQGLLCEQFNVIVEKKLYGKRVLGIERSSFLINPQGILIQEWRKVKAKTHCGELLNFLKQL